MSKRKFEKGDWVKPNDKSPAWLKKAWEDLCIVRATITGYSHRWSMSSYHIDAFDATGKKVNISPYHPYSENNPGIQSTYLDKVGRGDSRDTTIAKIKEYDEKIQTLQKAKSKLEDTIHMMDSLEIDTIDEDVVAMSRKLMDQGFCDTLKEAYQHALELKEVTLA